MRKYKKTVVRNSEQFYLNEVDELLKNYTICVNNCALHNQNIDMIILFACLFGWLDSLLLEIEKIRHNGLHHAYAQGLWTMYVSVHIHVRLQEPQFLAHCKEKISNFPKRSVKFEVVHFIIQVTSFFPTKHKVSDIIYPHLYLVSI